MSEDSDYFERSEAADMAADAREELREAFDEALAWLEKISGCPGCKQQGEYGDHDANCPLAAFFKKWSKK